MITEDNGNHDSTSSHPPLRLSASSRTESLPAPDWMTGFRSFSGRFSSLEVTGVRLTGRRLGKGSNATVEEVEWQKTFCAAKILHEILLDDDNPGGSQRFVEGFLKECQTWSKLSHPHVVQFLGVYYNPGSARIPNLLLEKMDTSLRVFLEENNHLLPDKIFILLQVVQGLAYLHSHEPALVHHDLSPNNILLNREVLLAKLTDFGMSRVVDPSGGSRKSSVKGTQAFMPPEALVEPPHYDEKLDVFSFGNVIIITLTHAWPNPGAFNKYKGNKIIALTEFERREHYVIQFSPEESTVFVGMVRSCLENRPNQRPTSLQLVDQMRQIEKDHPRKKLTEGPAEIEQLHAQLRENATQLQAKDTQLQANDTQLQEKDTQLQAKDTQLRESATHIAQLREENQRLKQESPASSICHAKPFKPVQDKLFRSDLVRPGEHHSIKMPDLLIPTWLATPVTIGRDVYLVGGFTARVKIAKLVQVYNMDSGECRTLPPSPQFNSAAVAIDGNLVLIGGKSSPGKFINMVSTWMVAEERWTQALPPMKMNRYRPGVLLLNNHLFVFGGMGEDENKSCLDSFEVLDLNTKQWSEGCGSLRQCLSSPRLGEFGDYVMLYGGATSGGTATRACYTVPVQALVDSVTNPLSPPIHWTPVQRAPYYRSSLLTTSQDAVRLIGGADSRDGQATIEIGDRDQQVTRAIHRFSSSGSWEVIGELSEPRSEPTVVAVSDRSFLVLGGCSDPKEARQSLLKSVELISY